MKRRSFLALLGASPVAAKAAVDAEVAKGMGLNVSGLATGGSGQPPQGRGYAGETERVPWETKLLNTSDHVKMFGLPQFADDEMRESARDLYGGLDIDIANKRSWSMAVKVMTQRQRNYDRALARIHDAAWHQRGRTALKTLLGFSWPW